MLYEGDQKKGTGRTDQHRSQFSCERKEHCDFTFGFDEVWNCQVGEIKYRSAKKGLTIVATKWVLLRDDLMEKGFSFNSCFKVDRDGIK